jgi:tetratricopeptide (TPR) repeat protein
MHLKDRFDALIEDFSVKLRIDRALVIAENGNPLKAIDVLIKYNRLPDNHEELDVLARLYLKVGDFKHARICWEQANKSTSNNTKYKDALKALEKYVALLEQKKKLFIKIGLIALAVFTLSFLSFFAIKWFNSFHNKEIKTNYANSTMTIPPAVIVKSPILLNSEDARSFSKKVGIPKN